MTILVVRLIADRASRVRMKFVPPLERIAGPVMGLVLAVMFTSFVACTLLMIPIAHGEWDFNEAAGWQQTTFLQVSSPFATIAKKYAQQEGVELPISAK